MDDTLNTQMQNNPTLPLEYFRPEIQAIIKEYSSIMNIPQQWVICSVMGLVSIALGRKITIFDGIYENHPCAWILLIGISGGNKSLSIKALKKPLEEIDKQLKDSGDLEVEEWKNNKCRGPKPPKKFLLTSETTLEGIQSALAANPDGLGFVADEAAPFFDFAKYSHSTTDEYVYMSIRDGDGFTVVRKNSDLDISAPYTFLSFLSSTQIETIKGIMKKEWLTNGFAPRFYYSFANYKMRLRSVDEPMLDPSLVKGWNDIIKALYYAPKTTLTLSSDAKKCYTEYWNYIEKTKTKYQESDKRKFSMYAKFQKGISEILGIVHYMCSSAKGGFYVLPSSDEISPLEVKCTTEIINYFISQYLKLLNVLDEDKQNDIQSAIVKVYNFAKTKMPNLSQSQFATSIGIDRSNFNKILKKQNGKPHK